jgi:hypothetical protein
MYLTMSHMIVIDDNLYEQIKKTKDKLPEMGCKNPSYSNSLRSMLDLPHISSSGRYDNCGATKTIRRMKIAEGGDGKELS